MLKVNTSLTNLNLHSNGIGIEGAAAMGKALEVNASLIYLNLHKNAIGDEGATAIGKALAVNTSLTNLECACLLTNALTIS